LSAPALAVPPMRPFAPLNAARVSVRAVAQADLADLLEVNGDADTTRFLPYAPWASLDDGIAWLGRMQTLAATGTAQQLVIERHADHKVLGTVLLFRFDAGSARLELGYVLGRSHWRQGYAGEALTAVLRQAFDDMAIRRVEAEVHVDNTASGALLRALGFTHEGVLRQRWVAKGQAYDVNAFGCLASEWPRRSAC